ncbi:MAG: hypothetical protein DI535_16095 [Citrobacter freundii]|nr:MAG: hypothetical protein DI535_16095 [Citrobacter freundii]
MHWYDIYTCYTNYPLMNTGNKPPLRRSNKNQNIIVRSLPKMILDRLYRMIANDHEQVSLPYIQNDGVSTDGMRTDPAALSTRTLLSSKRSFR